MVAESEHHFRHVVKYDRIGVIEIPLVGVECRHHDFPCLRAPGEIARCSLREYLRNGLFVFVRDLPVVKKEVPALELGFAVFGTDGPLMILAGMIHYKIQADIDTAVVTLSGECRQVIHRSKLRLYLCEIGNGVSAITSPYRTRQKGHQMQVVDVKILQIIQVLHHPV